MEGALSQLCLTYRLILSSRYDAYLTAAKQFTWSQASLMSKDTAASEIDRVLRDCLTSVGFFRRLYEMFADISNSGSSGVSDAADRSRL